MSQVMESVLDAARYSVCRILQKQDDRFVVVGSGCLVKNEQQKAVIASSKKVTQTTLLAQSTGSPQVEYFAEFKTRERGSEGSKRVQLHIGIDLFADRGIVFIPIHDDGVLSDANKPIEKCDILNHAEKLTKVQSNTCRVLVCESYSSSQESASQPYHWEFKLEWVEGSYRLRDDDHNKTILTYDCSGKCHLAVCGAPILTCAGEFLGVIDPYERQTNSRLNVLLGTSQGAPSPEAPCPDERKNGKTKISAGDPLRNLLDDIDFKDQFYNALDRTYREFNVKNWVHLAAKFKVAQTIYEKIAVEGKESPTEKLFEYLEIDQPDLKIKELCEALQKADAHETLGVLNNYLAEGKITELMCVTEFMNIAPDIIGEIMPKLDKDSIWQSLANHLHINRETFKKFESSISSNPTRDLFTILWKERIFLTVGDLKQKLEALGRKDVLTLLDKFQDNQRLDSLQNEISLMNKIEGKLNHRGSNNWRNLAELYKKEGHLGERKIEDLEPNEQIHSPTKSLMQYVLARQPTDVKTLIEYLTTMRRSDCLEIVVNHLQGGWFEVEQVQRNAGLTTAATIPGVGSTKQPSPSDDNQSSPIEETQDQQSLPNVISSTASDVQAQPRPITGR